MNKSQADLFRLLRIALWDSGVAIDDFFHVDWNTIYLLAKEQCVVGLVADSFSMLNERQCQGLNKLQWLGYVIQLEHKNADLNNFVGRLFEHFNTIGVSPVLMKGQAFAVNYPTPLHRQCGDIDVYFKDREGCKKAVSWAKKVDKVAAGSFDNKREHKHFTFSVADNIVELHYSMCLFENACLQHRLQEIIDWEFAHCNPFYVEINGKQIETVPPTLSVLHQVLHIARHLLEAGIGLRQICDLAVYLNIYHDEIDTNRLNGYLKELELMPVARALGHIMVENLSVQKNKVLFGEDNLFADFILGEIFEGGNFGMKKLAYRRGKNVMRRKLNSIAYFYHRCQLYNSLLPKEVKSYFWNKIKLNIKLIFVRHY